MSRWRPVSAVLFSLLLAAPAHSAPERWETAWNLVLAAKSWRQLYDAWKRYPDCDDGAVADSYSEFVVHTLATRWSTLGDAKRLMDRDPAFRSLVLEHIDATTDNDDLAKIVVNAKTRRPRGSAALCREIAKRAQAALGDIRNAGRP